MRLLITGVSGLLGLNAALRAQPRHTVIGVDRLTLANTPFDFIRADLLEENAVERILDETKPDALLHCAALANIDSCEKDPETARRLNAILPGSIAASCKQRGIRLIHISTDAVFDGKKAAPYLETDSPRPLSVYAQTKLAGEKAVLEANQAAVVARVNFYGWSLSGKRSLAEFFVSNLREGNHVNGFTDVRFCPAFVGDLADILLKIFEKNLHGLYHAFGGEAMSKYEFGVRIARQFGFDESLVLPRSVEESGLTARRSHNLHLSIHKLVTDLGISFPSFSAGLTAFHTQYQQGYPQKIQRYTHPGIS